MVAEPLTNHILLLTLTMTAMQEIDGDSAEAKETAALVFSTAALAAGYVLDNAAEYSLMVTKMMTRMAEK